MSLIRLTHVMKGLPIIDIQEGRKIATFEDIMIDPDTLKPGALITSKGNMLKHELKWIPGKNVKVWGKDAILVAGLDLIQDDEDFSGPEKWMSVWDEVKGRTVISMDGTRIAQIADMFMDEQGNFVAYDLSQVHIQGPLAESRRLEIDATHSLGSDVLVIKLSADELLQPQDSEVQAATEPVHTQPEETEQDELQHA